MADETIRYRPNARTIRRQNELVDFTGVWAAAHPGENPDDDPEYVKRAREIMGLPPLR